MVHGALPSRVSSCYITRISYNKICEEGFLFIIKLVLFVVGSRFPTIPLNFIFFQHFERIHDYFDKNIFSKYQCGFRKDFSTQHALLVMIEKMKIDRDDKQFCAAILSDLSKAFDCICHDVLIAKLNTYGFDRNALKLIYLIDRSQKTKAGSLFRAYLDIIYGVPQVVYHLYFANFANFVDDTTPCECGPTLNEVMNNLETQLHKKCLNGLVSTT